MTHYNTEYFDYQKKIGKIGGYLNKFKFDSHIPDPNISLLDFGCGGGYLLEQINAKSKLGFDISASALEECKSRNIPVTNNLAEIDNNSQDIIISNHALEHVPNPLQSLEALRTKLKVGGKMIIVVPCEQPHEEGFTYKEGDINQHLHTWCPQSLGNLANLAGLKVISCDSLQHQWHGDWQSRYKEPSFHKECFRYAEKNNNYQIKLVCTKE